MSQVASRVYRDIPRVPVEQLSLLDGLAVADISDILSDAGVACQLLTSRIRAVIPGACARGQAITGQCLRGDGLIGHCALYLAQPSDMLMLSSEEGSPGAIWGGKMTVDARCRGLSGVVVDGPVRDTASIRELGFPVWAAGTSVLKGRKAGEGSVNVPIRCGGASVTPGDIVVADDDGVLVFSPQHIDLIAARSVERSKVDANLLQRMHAGERLFETQNFAARLPELGVEIRAGSWTADATE